MSVRVYWLDCRRVDPAAERVWALMSENRRAKLREIHDETGRRQSAAAELALVLAMAHERGAQPQAVDWHVLPGGKPAIKGGLCFNLAHAGVVAVCAVCERPVGVDVEAPRHIPAAMRRKIYSSAEQDRPDDMLRWTWVAKESFIKLTGEGLKRSMAGFWAREGEILDSEGNLLACVQTVAFARPEYILCVCTQQRDTVRVIDLDW